MEPLVDVNIAVYNHASYLRQTLTSVLNQKTNFAFRLIIGDDCSTDGSKEILEEYKLQFPDKILLILQKKNLGLYGSERNGIIILKNSTAKYIALLDGDDYWIDDRKLQKQVDFLEANSDYAICYHRVEELRSDGSRRPESLNTGSEPRTLTIEDIAQGNTIHTPTVIFRNGFIEPIPPWVNDFVLHMLNARFGKIYYMPEIMATYRVGVGMYGTIHSDKRVIAWAETLRHLLDLEWSETVRKKLTQALATANAVIQRNKHPRYYGARDFVVRLLGLGKIKRAIKKALTSA